MPRKERKTKRIFAHSPTRNRSMAELERRIGDGLERDVINDNIAKIHAEFASLGEKMPAHVESLLKQCIQPALILTPKKKKKFNLIKSPLSKLHLVEPPQSQSYLSTSSLKDHKFIQPLTKLNQSLTALSEQYPSLSQKVSAIQREYSNYISAWQQADIIQRKKLLIPKPELCCEGHGYYYLPLQSSLQILSRNEFGDRRKRNELGNRPVFAGPNGVHYKAQPERDFIQPGNEKLASETYNAYDSQLAAPSLLLKLNTPKKVILEEHQVTPKNKQYYQLLVEELETGKDTETILTQRPDIAENVVISYVPFSDCVQASLTIEGILFLEILQLKQTLSTLSKKHSPDDLNQLINSIVSEAEQLKSRVLPQEVTLESVKKEYEDFFATLTDDKKPLDCSQAEFDRTFTKHRPDGPKKLHDILQLLKKFPGLMPGLKLIDLMQLPKELTYLSKLWPTCTTQDRLVRFNQFFNYWNSTNAQRQFIANLILFPTDWKADNIIVNWTVDQNGNLQEWRIVGIDNDGVLPARAIKRKRFDSTEESTYHSVEVKCIPFCIGELLNQDVSPETRELLVHQIPTVTLITRIKAVYEQNLRYERMKRTGALIAGDLTEQNFEEESPQQKLDIPVRLNLQAILALYKRLQRLYEAGQSQQPLTLAELFTHVDPLVAGAYDLAIQTTDNNPLDAFEKVTKPSLEDAFGDALNQNNFRAKLHAAVLPKQEQQLQVKEDYTPEELIAALLQHFAAQNPAAPGQLPPAFEILSAVATIFSDVPLDLKIPEQTLNQWLLLATQQGDALNPQLVLFLIEQGANPTIFDEGTQQLLRDIIKDEFDPELVFNSPANSVAPASGSFVEHNRAQSVRQNAVENNSRKKTAPSFYSSFFGMFLGALLGAVSGFVIHNPITCLLAAWRAHDWDEWGIANILRAYIIAPLFNPFTAIFYGLKSGFEFGGEHGVTELLQIPKKMAEPFKSRTIIAGIAITLQISLSLLFFPVLTITLPSALAFVGTCILLGGIGYEVFEFIKSESELQQGQQKRTAPQRSLSDENYSWQVNKLRELPVQSEPSSEQSLKLANDHPHVKYKPILRTNNRADNNAANNLEALYIGSWKSWFQIPRTPPITYQEEQSNASLRPPNV